MKIRMKPMMKRFAAMIFALTLLAGTTAMADTEWYCPQCGTRNNGNFCPVDGTKKPDLEGCGNSFTEGAVDLVTMNAYYTGEISLFSSVKDTFGTKYNTGMRGYMEPGSPNCFNIWDIGGKYSTLTATCIIRSQDKGSQCTGSFKIYGDDKLLYQQSDISSMTKPFPICVDVRGVTDLKIEMYGNGNMGTHGINSVLVDVMLHP